MTDERLLTRDELAALILNEQGVPVPLSRIERDTINGKGPRPVAKYGRRYLYTPDEARAYGRSLITPLGESKVA
jgi:hypothetical protein